MQIVFILDFESVPSDLSQKPGDLHSWLKSVNDDPCELEHSLTLYPFYNLKHCLNLEALRAATIDYLKNELKQLVFKKRDEIADQGQKAAQAKKNGCFPGWMIVLTKEGNKRMDQLAIDDHVMTIDKKGNIKWTPVYAYLHREPDTPAQFVVMICSNGRKLALTPNHVLVLTKDAERITELACEVKTGKQSIQIQQ
jgi:hypothetical protein